MTSMMTVNANGPILQSCGSSLPHLNYLSYDGLSSDRQNALPNATVLPAMSEYWRAEHMSLPIRGARSMARDTSSPWSAACAGLLGDLHDHTRTRFRGPRRAELRLRPMPRRPRSLESLAHCWLPPQVAWIHGLGPTHRLDGSRGRRCWASVRRSTYVVGWYGFSVKLLQVAERVTLAGECRCYRRREYRCRY